MRNDPSRPPAGRSSAAVGRSATLAGYAIFALALTIVLAVLLGDRRSIARLGDLDRVQQAELIPFAVHPLALLFNPDFRIGKCVETVGAADEHDLDRLLAHVLKNVCAM